MVSTVDVIVSPVGRKNPPYAREQDVSPLSPTFDKRKQSAGTQPGRPQRPLHTNSWLLKLNALTLYLPPGYISVTSLRRRRPGVRPWPPGPRAVGLFAQPLSRAATSRGRHSAGPTPRPRSRETCADYPPPPTDAAAVACSSPLVAVVAGPVASARYAPAPSPL